ncbi:adenylyltransferase/cytidyltransferase family protein [Xylophilus sp. GOD-11R]|uniref:adenylyltransferase/cytidyltransferase family protein n=1 Tax=Xylophilus sp. GOD-11R TaxID=3089814 RepID=UPI00298CB15F|nr:adenylyltransferase/cytidyltransferase family protein [Xylophilus sp. GOD-11R]WPB58503.1 adenylyltransferase/cytidyltransferase family protein [Xylophilus sp. GOD-11R]
MSADKICDTATLADRIAALPRPLVFTNGVFDLLHRGHVDCLQRARALGASLVVGLNSDLSARGLGKGAGRPLVPWEDRAAVLAALASVDLVVGFDEPAPLALLDRLRPEVYAKGGDYDMATLAEAARVRGWGASAVALPLLPGRSTSALVRRIRSLDAG